mmetsp:Transcript_15751/g.45013  ORF Transcript_15751/g.45013 Transcript_15751/m.45013 type:complete len:367 (-) Transcript_15751:312-1412(-)
MALLARAPQRPLPEPTPGLVRLVHLCRQDRERLEQVRTPFRSRRVNPADPNITGLCKVSLTLFQQPPTVVRGRVPRARHDRRIEKLPRQRHVPPLHGQIRPRRPQVRIHALGGGTPAVVQGLSLFIPPLLDQHLAQDHVRATILRIGLNTLSQALLSLPREPRPVLRRGHPVGLDPGLPSPVQGQVQVDFQRLSLSRQGATLDVPSALPRRLVRRERRVALGRGREPLVVLAQNYHRTFGLAVFCRCRCPRTPWVTNSHGRVTRAPPRHRRDVDIQQTSQNWLRKCPRLGRRWGPCAAHHRPYLEFNVWRRGSACSERIERGKEVFLSSWTARPRRRIPNFAKLLLEGGCCRLGLPPSTGQELYAF